MVEGGNVLCVKLPILSSGMREEGGVVEAKLPRGCLLDLSHFGLTSDKASSIMAKTV